MSLTTPFGSTVGGYRVVSLLGRGGMSVVYLAEDLRLGRKVALKVLAPALAQDSAFRERFIRESRLAAELEHPNVIPIYDAGEVVQDGLGLLYIAMRYVEGSDLETVLEREGAVSPARAVRILEQVARALDAAHRRGLVHRDVKPANILIAEASDHVYLTDFGVVKHTATRGLTNTGMFVGTLDYAAPEQIEGLPLDGRADVYALGSVLYECVVGKAPFARKSELAVLHAHLVEPPPSLSGARPDLPRALDEVVARAMAKSRDTRFSTPSGLIQAARAALVAPSPVRLAAPSAAALMLPPIEAFVAPAADSASRRARATLEWLVTAALALLALIASVGLIMMVAGVAGPDGS